MSDRHALGVPTRQEIAATADRLRQARTALGLTQTEFARPAALTQNRYNQYETGARALTLDAATKLCNAHGLSLDWLYRGDGAFMPHGLMRKIAPPP